MSSYDYSQDAADAIANLKGVTPTEINASLRRYDLRAQIAGTIANLITYTQIEITPEELAALDTTPKTIVPAVPGAMLFPTALSVAYALDVADTAPTTDLKLLIGAEWAVTLRMYLNTAGLGFALSNLEGGYQGYAATDVVDQPLAVQLAAPLTTGVISHFVVAISYATLHQ